METILILRIYSCESIVVVSAFLMRYTSSRQIDPPSLISDLVNRNYVMKLIRFLRSLMFLFHFPAAEPVIKARKPTSPKGILAGILDSLEKVKKKERAPAAGTKAIYSPTMVGQKAKRLVIVELGQFHQWIQNCRRKRRGNSIRVQSQFTGFL